MQQTIGRQDLERLIADAMDKHRYCAFATVEGDRPKARYMALFHDGLRIHLATDRRTHKVEELHTNPNVYLLFGFEGRWPAEVVEMEGRASVSGDEALRKKVWNEELQMWFKGPDDPNCVILDIEPVRIEYRGKAMERQIWEA